MLQSLETALAGGLGQMSLVKGLPDVSTTDEDPIDWVETSGNHLTSDICPNPPASAISRF